MAKYFPNNMYWKLVFQGVFINLIISALVLLLSKNFIIAVLFFIIYQIYLTFYYKIRLEHFAEKVFNARLKKGLIDTKFEIVFYNNYLIRKSDKFSLNINYNEITKSIETDTHFYLEYPKLNFIIIIQKNRCDLGLVNFIKEKFNNLEKY